MAQSSAPKILTADEFKAFLLAAKPPLKTASRRNVALNKGGSADIFTFSDRTQAARLNYAKPSPEIAAEIAPLFPAIPADPAPTVS